MEVNIILRDPSDDVWFELSISPVSNSRFHMTFHHGRNECSGSFDTEELRLALRKLTAQ